MSQTIELLKEALKDVVGGEEYKIYCDMDGVLTNFEKQFEKYAGVSADEFDKTHNISEFWKVVDEAGLNYWTQMEWMSGGKQLWNFIKTRNTEILSAPSRSKLSVEGKKQWVSKNLSPNVKLNLVNAKDKQKFANSHAILIDDKPENLQQWKASGGIAIKCVNGEVNTVIEKLKKYV